MPEASSAPDTPLQTIAVFRALQLGDMLCAVPALRALRQAHPQARITLLGLPWARAFAARFAHLVDDFIAVPGYPGLPEQPWDPLAVTGFLKEAQARRFDLFLQLHGSGRVTNGLAQLVGARRSAGYHLPGDPCADAPADFLWRDEEHEVARWVRLLGLLGMPPRGMELEFPLHQADLAGFRRLGREQGLASGTYVCLHPGSQLPSRRWLPAAFAQVGDVLAQAGYRVVITGTGPEMELARTVAGSMRAEPLVLAGRTSLGVLGALIGQAAGLVCNDTGVSHIAAATGTPSVVVSCGSDPRRWAPLDTNLHRVMAAEVACRPCMHRECPIGHPCARGIEASQVAAAMLDVLRLRPAVPADRLTGALHG